MTNSLCVLAALACIGQLVVASSPTSVEIAPGVMMPIINHGSGNQTLWAQLGGHGMDTALSYGVENQANIGKAVDSNIVNRSDLFITTKIPCCPSHYYDYGMKECADPSVNLKDPVSEITTTLQLSGIKAVDLLLMHWPCDQLESTVAVYKAMEAALSKGLTRAFGVSNFNASALAALMGEAKVKPAVTQNQYSIANHFDSVAGNDDATLNFCKKHGITMSAWAPLGGASGKSGSIFNNSIVSGVAKAHNKSTAQIALRWTIQRGVVPVTAGDNPQHLRDDLDVFDFELTDDEMERLASIGKPASG